MPTASITAATASNCGFARDGGVQVDDVETAGPRRLPAPPGLGGIAAVDRLLLELPLAQAHHAPAAEVDRRDDDHCRASAIAAPLRFAARKATQFSIILRPTPWLFSGWNCTPSTLPRPTMAGKLAVVVRRGDHHVLGGVAVVGVDEVDVGAVLDSVEERVGTVTPQPVPAHVGNRQRSVDSPHAARKEAEAPVEAVLLALLEEDLHADADAQERLPGRGGLLEHPHEAAAPDLVHRRAEGAVPGQDEGVGGAQHRRVSAQHGLGPRVAKSLGHAPEVADPVVDDGDHSLPLVLGTPFTRGSRATAMREGPRAGLEQRLGDVVRVAAPDRFEVDVEPPVVGEGPEEVLEELRGHGPDLLALKGTS